LQAAKCDEILTADRGLPVTKRARKPYIVPAGEGRAYEMGRIRAVFKADQHETAGRYSISEWWLEPKTWGPGAHSHSDDHVYYVIEGSLNLMVGDSWSVLDKGGYALIPGGTVHNFENRGAARVGFISLNTPAGFKERMAGIAPALAAEDLRIDGSG
jgi:mannose-6-phosphate isomerase-like protein (cupin superfamily)